MKQQQVRDVEAGKWEDDPCISIRLRYMENEVEILQRAYEAAKADADAHYPGRSSSPDPKTEEVSRLRERGRRLARNIETGRQEVQKIRDWMSQLPDDVQEARKLAQQSIDNTENSLEGYLDQYRGVSKALKELGVDIEDVGA